MRLDVVSLAPEAFTPLLSLGVIGRAFAAGIAELHLHNPRDHAPDRYRKVDDEPYGGGAGMVLKPEPVFSAFEAIPRQGQRRVLLMSPQGRPLHQSDLQHWACFYDQLVLPDGRIMPLKVKSIVGLVPMFAVTVIDEYDMRNNTPAISCAIASNAPPSTRSCSPRRRARCGARRTSSARSLRARRPGRPAWRRPSRSARRR
jgi:hypothetical protein